MGSSVMWGGAPSQDQMAAMRAKSQVAATAQTQARARADAALAPVDQSAAFFRAMALQKTNQQLAQSRGRTNAFLSMPAPGGGAGGVGVGEPYRAPGSKSTLGG
jgi:hypothetical protein